MNEDIKRWTAKRKSARVMEIIQGKQTVTEASRAFDLTPSEIEEWVDQAKAGMENALRAKPKDVRQQYERQLKDLQGAYGEAILELRARKKVGVPAGKGRVVIDTVRQDLRDERSDVSISKLCCWFGFLRRTWYYRSVESTLRVKPELET
ncbi:DUF1153 domain-containing protein [Vreelandella malpeensis]|uniref:DUF1153 domain-containing protein n=1 Tax=Vreelandella malpeensis TaxID=1172368 RepID=UPI001D09B25F|nr:DUF1153 domain-containing protein [Halomonas malpeensis]